MIRIYTAGTEPLFDDARFNSAYAVVSEYRRKKTDTLRFAKDKCLSLGSELLLKHALKELGFDYNALHIAQLSYGKPYFADCPIHFNLSHSARRVMCAVSDLPIGCDVELMAQADIRIARRFFAENEYKYIASSEDEADKQDKFYRLWTLKESFIKCIGLGMALPLNSFTVNISQNNITVHHRANQNHYALFEYNAHDGYKYAWCVENAGTNAAYDFINTDISCLI